MLSGQVGRIGFPDNTSPLNESSNLSILYPFSLYIIILLDFCYAKEVQNKLLGDLQIAYVQVLKFSLEQFQLVF